MANILYGLFAGYGDVDLRGDAGGMFYLADRLGSGDVRVALTPPPGLSPQPYDAFLSTLSIEKTVSALLQVRRMGEDLILSGANEAIVRFSDLLFELASNPPRTFPPVGFHIHVEHYDGHAWLHERSEPLVVTLLSTTERRPVTQG